MAKHLMSSGPFRFSSTGSTTCSAQWIAAPFYWLGGPTVAMLRMPLLMINAAVAVWLLR